MKRYILTLLLLLLPTAAAAASLRYEVSGLDGALLQNAKAWLGDAPDTDRERQNFIASARKRVASSLRALGYYDPLIEIKVERTDPQWTLRIAVQPGEPVRLRNIDLRVTGAASSDAAFNQLLAEPGFARGDPLHHGHYEDLRSRLLALAQRRGYFDAEFTDSRVAVDTVGGSADITLHLDSGERYEFGEIVFDETQVSADMLDALRTFARGDAYDQSAVQNFQASLQRTGFFAAVVVEPLREQAQSGQVPVAVSLHPAKRHAIDVGVGFSTDTQERLSLTWRTPRINRYGHSQQTRLVLSQVNPSGRINYQSPLTHPLDDLLSVWARVEENEFGDLDSQQRELGTRRELRTGSLVWGYSLRGLDESWELLDSDQRNDYLLFGASLSTRSIRGSLLDPAGGLSQLYTVEYGNQDAGSDVDLLRATALLRYVASPLPQHRVVARAEFGAAEVQRGDRDDLAPSLNFFAGGNQSIRGFGYQSIGNEIEVARADGSDKRLVVGGTRLAVLSFEYQYYFNDRWRGAIFTDGGDAFDAGDFDWNVGAGFGLHYVSPVGAIRVEFARDVIENDANWRLHLNIGAEF
ncbi:MAG: autotransporter assembly complex family protein [Halioglobus sp.]